LRRASAAALAHAHHHALEFQGLNFYDLLESDDFDPVAFINKTFPTERSLQGVEGVITKLDTMVVDIEKDIKV